MARTGQPAVRQLGTVQRALTVLDVLAEAEEAELGTNEIARRAGVNASTVSRLLATLADRGLVEFVAETGRYRLGLRLLQLGNAVLSRLDLREVARPHLRALVEATGETVTLSAPGEHEAITVDFVQSRFAIQSVAQLGRPSVAHATSVGKVYLACGGELPEGELRAFTPRTIVDRGALARAVEEVRARGWAQAVGEREDGLNAISAPVWGTRGELVAILGVQGPASRFDEPTMARAVEPLLARARAISDDLGAPPRPGR